MSTIRKTAYYNWLLIAIGLIALVVLLVFIQFSRKLSSNQGPTPEARNDQSAANSQATRSVATQTAPIKEIAQLPPVITDPKGVMMILIPKGEFVMGSSADIGYAECMAILDGKGCARYFFTNEEPAHHVYLDDFYIDMTEVSNADYLPCVEEQACKPPYYVDTYTRDEYFYSSEFANYPITSVTWEQAQNYCKWRGGSLPTEAQWEKAARGTDARIYPWGNEFDKTKVNICDNNCPIPPKRQTDSDNFADTAPVSSFPNGASPYGLLNMAGNVWEWVFDWYDEDYYRISPKKNPVGPESGPSHVRRGGGWMNSGSFIRTTVRAILLNDPLVHYQIGFRCAKSAAGFE